MYGYARKLLEGNISNLSLSIAGAGLKSTHLAQDYWAMDLQQSRRAQVGFLNRTSVMENPGLQRGYKYEQRGKLGNQKK